MRPEIENKLVKQLSTSNFYYATQLLQYNALKYLLEEKYKIKRQKL
ncbi:21458_t:CDS:2 [Cetraspora pellucida]|uniref:21458_t:CDS:1 n=1 Tax=Cetraspora pellucida TaxID=1433469 RepID=A0A9N9GKM1_9GLOM|nr:21458_t:CDS:2 [Cetraspora pellucida]